MAPIDPAVFAPFLLAVLLIEFTPGPNMGYLAALSASNGRAAGLRAVLGGSVATFMTATIAGVLTHFS